MTTDYKQLLKDYPTYMSLEQMRVVSHISKKTARLLLKNGLVPCTKTGKKTRCYRITKSAVIKYLMERETTPEKYMLLERRFTRKLSHAIPTDNENIPPIDLALFEEYPDVLSVREATVLSDVTPETVKRWAKSKRIRAFLKNGAYHIPKLALLEYLSSPRHKRNQIWKQNILSKHQEI